MSYLRVNSKRRIRKFRDTYDDRRIMHLLDHNASGRVVGGSVSNEFLEVNNDFLNENWEFLSGD